MCFNRLQFSYNYYYKHDDEVKAMKHMTKRFCSLLLAVILTVSVLGVVSPAASASEMKSAIGTVTASALRLRKGPGTNTATVDVAPCGDVALVIGSEGDWYKVVYNLQTGYMHKDYLKLDEVKNVKIGKARFECWTNVRQGPGTDTSILDCAPQGSTCFIEGFDHGWFKVTYSGKTGYVRSDLLTMLEIPYCNADGSGNSDQGNDGEEGKTATFLYYTNVRKGPGTDYSILTCAPKNSTCTVYALKDGWYQINYKGISGYVRSDLVSVKEETGSGDGSGSEDSHETPGLANGNMSKNEKLQFVFGRTDISDPRSAYSNDGEARAHMKTVTVKTWDVNSSGEKYTRLWDLSVHENIAPTVEAIFAEIYALPEQPLIHSLGGYRWAGLSEHSVGLAIDVNPNENYYCDPNGKALSGSYFRPGEDPYSIPVGGSIDQIFAKYGFTRGIYWRSGYKDYMHYSFFGT